MEPKKMELVVVERKEMEESMHSPPQEIAVGEAGGAKAVAARPPAVFLAIALMLPQRLYKEDLGDAMETLAALENVGAPPWQRRLKICSTCGWLLVNVVRELTSVLHGKSASSKS